ncbi:MAG: hypothetical protein H0U61_02560 [Nocardioidaceae bacterium]|nr:hypothetical protein [Nocardioidaceae bacterium]
MNLADPPTTWVDPAPISTLHALLFFGGLPLLIIAVITLLVMAPSLAKGSRYHLGQDWEAEPHWFGGPGIEAADVERRAITSQPTNEPESTGGASGRW